VHHLEVQSSRVFSPYSTSSSAIVERQRCMVGQFWPKHKWKTIFCNRRRCQKTKSVDLLHDIQTAAWLRYERMKW